MTYFSAKQYTQYFKRIVFSSSLQFFVFSSLFHLYLVFNQIYLHMKLFASILSLKYLYLHIDISMNYFELLLFNRSVICKDSNNYSI